MATSRTLMFTCLRKVNRKQLFTGCAKSLKFSTSTCAMKIYTKTGDGGMSSLFTGERRTKHDAAFEALGTVDELSSNIGFSRELLSDSWQKENFEILDAHLQKVQCILQDIASCVATPLSTASEKHLSRTEFDNNLVYELETWIDTFSEDLPPLKNFILPSGGKCSSHLHISRSVCRRAERNMVLLHENNELDAGVLKYVNRLSDFLFTAARYTSSMEGNPELVYRRRKPGDESNENKPGTETVIEENVNDKP
uniref:Corrinoid adenosyltransferase MMAB n=1 Tax=Phallusia mammillata TaxID=59560 RepID=A0A6F9DLT2_9ASCI|nr:cob(I)yrinic acid a,c-diamide adenosyltransferase, mitochondrial-like [Phallusia mammillata]